MKGWPAGKARRWQRISEKGFGGCLLGLMLLILETVFEKGISQGLQKDMHTHGFSPLMAPTNVELSAEDQKGKDGTLHC